MENHNIESDYKYPRKYDEHMIHVPDKVKLPKFNADYPYRDKRLPVRLLMTLLHIVIQAVVFFILKLTTGIKVNNRKVLRKFRSAFKKGAITVSNHVHMWDFLCILLAIRPKRLYYPAWPVNLKGPNRHCIRLTGGIPVPDTLSGLRCFYKTLDEIIQEKKWLHFFAEGSMWNYYKGIRPFKPGAFKLSVKHKVPIIPLAINYRPAKGLAKLIHKDTPLLTINVGEPVFPVDKNGQPKTINEMLKTTRRAVQNLAGFNRIISQEETAQQAVNF